MTDHKVSKKLIIPKKEGWNVVKDLNKLTDAEFDMLLRTELKRYKNEPTKAELLLAGLGYSLTNLYIHEAQEARRFVYVYSKSGNASPVVKDNTISLDSIDSYEKEHGAIQFQKEITFDPTEHIVRTYSDNGSFIMTQSVLSAMHERSLELGIGNKTTTD